MHCLAYHSLLAPISIFIAPLSLIPFCSAINALALGKGGEGIRPFRSNPPLLLISFFFYFFFLIYFKLGKKKYNKKKRTEEG